MWNGVDRPAWLPSACFRLFQSLALTSGHLEKKCFPSRNNKNNKTLPCPPKHFLVLLLLHKQGSFLCTLSWSQPSISSSQHQCISLLGKRQKASSVEEECLLQPAWEPLSRRHFGSKSIDTKIKKKYTALWHLHQTRQTTGYRLPVL